MREIWIIIDFFCIFVKKKTLKIYEIGKKKIVYKYIINMHNLNSLIFLLKEKVIKKISYYQMIFY